MDEQEAVWLAWVHLRNRLGADAEMWVALPDVEVRSMGWVVSFRDTKPFNPDGGPQSLSYYVFRDSWVEVVTKHGPKFHEFRRRRFEEQRQTESGTAPDSTRE